MIRRRWVRVVLGALVALGLGVAWWRYGYLVGRLAERGLRAAVGPSGEWVVERLPPLREGAPPSMVTINDSERTTFAVARAPDGRLMSARLPRGALAWSAPEVGTVLASAPPLALPGQSALLDVYFRGVDGALLRVAYAGGADGWRAPAVVGDALPLMAEGATPAAQAMPTAGRGLAVFYRGEQDRLRGAQCLMGTCTAIALPETRMMGDPAVSLGPKLETQVFYLGMNRRIWYLNFDRGEERWLAPAQLGPAMAHSSPLVLRRYWQSALYYRGDGDTLVVTHVPDGQGCWFWSAPLDTTLASSSFEADHGELPAIYFSDPGGVLFRARPASDPPRRRGWMRGLDMHWHELFTPQVWPGSIRGANGHAGSIPVLPAPR